MESISRGLPPAESVYHPTADDSVAVGGVPPSYEAPPALAQVAFREVFNTGEAAEFLGVSKQLLELLRLVGGGPRYAKLGRLVRYRRIALDDWLSAHERDHTADQK